MNQPGASAANAFSALAGRFVLQPGQRTAISGARPIAAADLLSRLLKGQHFAATQARLGHVFTLCAHAHQRTCALAFAAATESASATGSASVNLVKPPPLALLRWETARDHLRTIALEWPQRLGEPSLQAEAMNWLRTCPVPLAGARQPSASEVCTSLAALHEWLAQDAGFPAQCLAHWRAQGKDLAVPLRPLDVLNADATTQEQQLRLLGQAIATSPDFTHNPQWQGACAETGPWTRLRHRRQPTAGQPVSAWARLEARWLELLDLAAAPALADDATHDPLLSSGALELGDGQAVAWCEMARGLLLHWLQRDDHGAVAQYRVIAPTEWNFHPQGALALALAACAPQDIKAAQTLAAAFDPCVECSVQTAAPEGGQQEHAHA
jgi:uncharacterized protein (DUF2237 family)